MKIFNTFTLIFSLSILILSSCSEEIKPSTDGKKTAVVYSVLDVNDSIHYVKITKAFYGAGDLTQTALIPDSSYFDEVDATVYELTNGAVTRSWKLRDTIIANKDSGAFYYPMQKVYYFVADGTSALKSDPTIFYKLDANINNGEFKVSGQTNLTGGITISSPSQASAMSFATNNIPQYGYASTLVNFNPGNSSKIEVMFDISFNEFNNTTLINTKTFTWIVDKIEQEDIKQSMVSGANGKTFYELMAQNVTKDNPLINKRQLKSIKIRINGASNELQTYMLVNQPSSSLAQNKPTYTNLTVSNGMRVVGIFASRTSFELDKPAWVYAGGSAYYLAINANSMKELCQGSITGQYFFCSDSPTDGGTSPQPYFCN